MAIEAKAADAARLPDAYTAQLRSGIGLGTCPAAGNASDPAQ